MLDGHGNIPKKNSRLSITNLIGQLKGLESNQASYKYTIIYHNENQIKTAQKSFHQINLYF